MTLYYQDKSRYHCQDNNMVEALLKKSGSAHWLETCGSTAAINCLEAMGTLRSLITPGGYKPQEEDLLTCFFNDPFNYAALKKSRPDIEPGDYFGNEIPQYYPLAVQSVFGVQCVYAEGLTADNIKAHLDKGQAVQICLSKPGHFVALVAYDKTGFIMWDSWAGRYSDGTGFNKPLAFDQIATNTGRYGIIYS